MKSFLIALLFVAGTVSAKAQEDEAISLALNIQKLAQLKQILTDLKKGYDILFSGYSMIKGIAEGNFNLHKTFLDGLLAVSPAVRNYKRVADIIDYQLKIACEYKIALRRFQSGNHLSADELQYIVSVYEKLVDGSVKNLDALAMVITAGKMRMSDDERMKAIDDIFRDMEDRLGFLRWFNNAAAVLGVQRLKEQNDVQVMKGLYGQ